MIIGTFAEVYLLDGKVIRKTPRSENEEDMQPIIREATIYNIIGVHPRIVECMSRGRGRAEYVDVKYYPHGDLASYCQKNKITPELRSRWFRQIIEAIIVIHNHGVIHSDLALRKFFMDNNETKTQSLNKQRDTRRVIQTKSEHEPGEADASQSSGLNCICGLEGV